MMRSKLAALAALALVAPVVAAQPASAQQQRSALSTQTPLQTLMANRAARAVVLKHLPGIEKHSAYDQFKRASLRQMLPYVRGAYTAATLDRIDADLAKLRAR